MCRWQCGDVRIRRAHGGPVEDGSRRRHCLVRAAERYWHGAAPTTTMLQSPFRNQWMATVVEWLQKVTDQEYRR